MLRIAATILVLLLGEAHADPGSWRLTPSQETSNHEIQADQGERADQSNPNDANRQPPAFWNFFIRSGQQAIAKYCAQTPKNEEAEWLQKFRCDISFADYWIAIGTVLIFVATILLGYLAWRQMVTVRRQLRAYVGVRSDIPPPNLIVGQKQTAGIVLTNHGGTPARSVRYRGDFIVLEYPLKQALPVTQWTPTLPVNPGQKLPSMFEMKEILNEETAAAIKADRSRFYLYGEVRYLDVFRCPRRTLFQFTYGGERLIGMGSFAAEEKGNNQT